jgi:hypothetical protein
LLDGQERLWPVQAQRGLALLQQREGLFEMHLVAVFPDASDREA